MLTLLVKLSITFNLLEIILVDFWLDQGDHHLPVPQALGDNGAGHVTVRNSLDDAIIYHSVGRFEYCLSRSSGMSRSRLGDEGRVAGPLSGNKDCTVYIYSSEQAMNTKVLCCI